MLHCYSCPKHGSRRSKAGMSIAKCGEGPSELAAYDGTHGSREDQPGSRLDPGGCTEGATGAGPDHAACGPQRGLAQFRVGDLLQGNMSNERHAGLRLEARPPRTRPIPPAATGEPRSIPQAGGPPLLHELPGRGPEFVLHRPELLEDR